MVKGKRVTEEVKLAVLQVILSKKEILFGQFSSTLDNPDKQKAWEEVTLKAKSLGACESSRDFKFVRDKMYGAWKMATMSKRDNAKRTGTGGGTKCILNVVDLKILEIIGHESPVLDGLPIGESGSPAMENSASSPIVLDTFDLPSGSSQRDSTPPPPPHKRKARFVHSDILDNKRKKQTELLEISIYNEKLRAYEKERELGLEPSKFTREFYNPTSVELDIYGDVILPGASNSK